MKGKVCVVTGSRAEYGLLRWVIDGIAKDDAFQLQIIVTGMHLSSQFGLTYKEIENDGFKIDHKVDNITDSHKPRDISKSIGVGITGFAEAIERLEPDLILLLGDRYEIFAAASAALISCVPVAHIHGGEVTEGAFDESLRHAITKMSHIHFVATEEYKKRVIQLGEQPVNVFNVGGLASDSIRNLKLLGRSELEAQLGIKFDKKNLLITFHPVTLQYQKSLFQFKELLSSLKKLKNTGLIFTLPNADTNCEEIIEEINAFIRNRSNAYSFKSLGQLRYFSCVAQVDGVVGNSSSGILEVPSFRKGTINIGSRQKGRVLASSVINCEAKEREISSAIKIMYSKNFQEKLPSVTNPYGQKKASENIVNILRKISLVNILEKKFYDFPDQLQRRNI